MTDRRLTAELFPGEEPQEEYGVFGAYAPGQPAAQLAYYRLYALQHCRQESAGIAVSNGQTILVYKDMGLVSQVFDGKPLSTLNERIGVGHVRYVTAGVPAWESAQPTLGPAHFSSSSVGPAPDDAHSGTAALAHDGNLTDTAGLMEEVRACSGGDLMGELGRGSSTDAVALTTLFGCIDTPSLTDAALSVLPRLGGVFSLALMDETRLYTARDQHGFRPLVLGRLDGGWVMVSETAALNIVDVEFEREINPGEFLAIGEGGVESHMWAEPKRAGCVFEYIYLARPSTAIAGRSVNSVHLRMGRILAEEHPVEADLAIATPSSDAPAAIGYAQGSGIPHGQGLMKNAYVRRTFITPARLQRQRGIRLKFNPMKEVIEGKRLVVADDSIVRDNTQRAPVAILREVGTAEMYIRISSPPAAWPYFFGIDFPARSEFIANSMGVEEIYNDVGADTLGYISLGGMVRVTEQARKDLCTVCFTGGYPVDVTNVAASSRSDLLGEPMGTCDPSERQ